MEVERVVGRLAQLDAVDDSCKDGETICGRDRPWRMHDFPDASSCFSLMLGERSERTGKDALTFQEHSGCRWYGLLIGSIHLVEWQSTAFGGRLSAVLVFSFGVMLTSTGRDEMVTSHENR